MRKIADAGLIIAALDERDADHGCAARLLGRESPPWVVCEPVLAEIAATIGTPEPVLEMLQVGDLELAFDLGEYRDHEMDLADACVVRMSEWFEDSVVYTVDRKDFTVYRRHGRRPVRCIFPG